MKRRVLVALLGLAGVWAGLFWMDSRGGSLEEPVSPQPSRSSAPEKHYVTPRQLTASGAMADRVVVPFRVPDQDGKSVALAELSAGRPLVLVFIKRDCPCSVEFEPFFHRVYEAYRGGVRFAGVIDGPPEVARRYADANHVPYPVLADAEMRLVRTFGAENGAYVALLTPDGILDMLWPGCSVEMMQELGRRIATLAGVDEVPIDATGMPEALLTGCPYSS